MATYVLVHGGHHGGGCYSGHDIMVSEPERLAEMLLRLA